MVTHVCCGFLIECLYLLQISLTTDPDLGPIVCHVLFWISHLFPCVTSLGFLLMHCTLSSRFSSCVFFCSSFYITTSSCKPGPGKLDYHGNSIFQILSSYGRLGAEQRRYHLKSAGSLITGLSRYVWPVVLCITDGWPYWLKLYYLSVALQTINSVSTQIT